MISNVGPSDIDDALSELEQLARTQAETESRSEWSESIDRLEAEAAALTRLLGAVSTVRAVGSEIAARIDAVVAAYSERIANIERQKEQNREELRSLNGARKLGRSALLSYSRA